MDARTENLIAKPFLQRRTGPMYMLGGLPRVYVERRLMSAKKSDKIPRGVFPWPGQKGVYGIRYDDVNGKDTKEKAGSLSTAKALYAKRTLQVLDGKKSPRRRDQLTVSQAIQRYLDTHQENATHADDLWHAKMARAAFGQALVDELDPHAIELWMIERAAATSNSTANRHLGFLKRCLRKAVRDQKADRDPTVSVEQLEEPPGRDPVLTEKQYNALRKAMQPEAPVPAHRNDWYKVEMAILTGFRRDELFKLSWDRTHFEWSPPGHEGPPMGGLQLRPVPGRGITTKTNRQKWVPMHSRVREILLEIRAEGADDYWVFPTDNGTPQSGHNFTHRQWKDAVEDAKIEDLHWHDLRHLFCSGLAKGGVAIEVIAELAGHSTLRMTQRYTHYAKKQLAEAVQCLALPSSKPQEPSPKPQVETSAENAPS